MGLTTEQFLEMEVWQYNAYTEAWEKRIHDLLAVELQGAWMTAYWSSKKKHKVSLKKVLKDLSRGEELPREKIDKKEVENSFRQFEEIMKHGWTKV